MNIGKKRMLSEIKNGMLADTKPTNAPSKLDINDSKSKVINAFQLLMGGGLKKNKENVPETKISSPIF